MEARSSGHDGRDRRVQELLAHIHEELEQLGNDKLISAQVVTMVLQNHEPKQAPLAHLDNVGSVRQSVR